MQKAGYAIAILAMLGGWLWWSREGARRPALPSPTPPTAAQAPADTAKWQQIAPGVEARRKEWRWGGTAATVSAVRADVKRCTIRVVDARAGGAGQGGRAAEVAPERGAAINGSFFDEDGTPLGLLVSGGKVKQKARGGEWCAFEVRGGKARISGPGQAAKGGTREGIQARPRLVVGGRSPKFLEQPPSRRAAVGIDGAGRLVMAATGTALTLEGWAQYMREEMDCREALNLDGGPSAQLAVAGRAEMGVEGLWDVPVFITVEGPKQEGKGGRGT